MGAFLVRFPKLRIKIAWPFGLLMRLSFWMPAYWLLPLWLVLEIYYGKVFGQADGVAHAAHIGGFIFGAAAAWAVRGSGFEHNANKAIEEKISWSADPEITRASELIDQKKFDEAAPILQKYVSDKPDSVAAWNLLYLVHWRRNEIEPCRAAAMRMCELNLKAGMYEAAWQNCQEFLNMGGEEIPPSVCTQLCRYREKENDFQWAFEEYKKIAAAHASERLGLTAQVGAARISLKHLSDPQEALKWYELASASAVPHLDLEPEIQLGIREAQAALLQRAPAGI